MKTMKRLLATMCIMAVVIAGFFPGSAEAKAKAKLSKSSISLYVGKTATIKLTGGKASKWTVQNGKIKILKQTKTSAKIQAMSTGTTYLYVKVGKKKLKCKVICEIKASDSNRNTKKSNFDEKEAKEKISVKKFTANNEICVELKSNYKVPTSIEATCNFVNSSGQVIDYRNDSISFLEKGHTAYLIFRDCDKEYDKTEIKYEFSEGLENFYHSSVIDDLTLTHNYIEDEYNPYIMLTVTNGGKKDCYSGEMYIVYYDENNNELAVESEYIGGIKGGSSENKKSFIPYDENYDGIKYHHCNVFIGWAYHLGK